MEAGRLVCTKVWKVATRVWIRADWEGYGAKVEWSTKGPLRLVPRASGSAWAKRGGAMGSPVAGATERPVPIEEATTTGLAIVGKSTTMVCSKAWSGAEVAIPRGVLPRGPGGKGNRPGS